MVPKDLEHSYLQELSLFHPSLLWEQPPSAFGSRFLLGSSGYSNKQTGVKKINTTKFIMYVYTGVPSEMGLENRLGN